MVNKFFRISVLIACALGVPSVTFANAPRTLEFRVEKIGDKTHWVPESVEVKPGEKLKIKALYDLEGGFEFHGLAIPELKIAKKVERKKPFEMNIEVPTTGVKELSVNCQFHPAHVGAKIRVK